MWGVSSHAPFPQVYIPRNKSCSFLPPHDAFVSCNHFVTNSALSWDYDAQMRGRVTVRTFLVRIYRARPNGPDRLLGTPEGTSK